MLRGRLNNTIARAHSRSPVVEEPRKERLTCDDAAVMNGQAGSPQPLY
jgi:hypothetical protein